jgi:hypothetical protein
MSEQRSSAQDVRTWLVDTVDAAAMLYLASSARGVIPTTLIVSRETYDRIVQVKARELLRGNPVMLLDMTVEPSDDLPVGAPRLR